MKEKFTSILIIVFLLLPIAIKSQVIISGLAPTYSNTYIEFKTSNDPFSLYDTILAKTRVASDGSFSCTIPTNETIWIYSNLGIYKGEMYIEPGRKYTILLPEKKDKTQADKLNPFFEPVLFHIAISDMTNDDINFKILAFDDAYYPYLNKFAQNPYSRVKPNEVKKAIADLQQLFNVEKSNYFEQYVTYRLGFLQHMAYQKKIRAISKQLFEGKPVLYNHPAYTGLLNHVFDRYFYFFGRTSQGKKIYSDINKDKSYSSLCETLNLDSTLQSDTLRELVILKNIHDEFYASNFSRSGLLAILDTLISSSKIEKNKTIALHIRKKITRLMPGYQPIPFELYNNKGELVKLSDFNGKYVYLNFCVCSSYSCIKEFDALVRVSERYKEKLVIVTISDDDNLAAMQEFVGKSGYQWIFLHTANQPNIMEQYDIRAFPTYLLIGPDGKLILSPAPSPAEGFEMRLFNIMRERKDL